MHIPPMDFHLLKAPFSVILFVKCLLKWASVRWLTKWNSCSGMRSVGITDPRRRFRRYWLITGSTLMGLIIPKTRFLITLYCPIKVPWGGHLKERLILIDCGRIAIIDRRTTYAVNAKVLTTFWGGSALVIMATRPPGKNRRNRQYRTKCHVRVFLLSWKPLSPCRVYEDRAI